MASNAPHTISVKRKRGDAPVDSLVAERNDKRIKSTPFPPADTPVLPGNPALKRKLEDDALSPTHPRKILWRRIKTPHTPESKTLLNSPLGYGSAREFRISHSDGLGVLVEHHQGQSDEIGEDKNEGDGDKEKEEEGDKIAPVATYHLKSSPQATSSPSKPRKRPGAGTAVQAREKLPLAPPVPQLSPSEETIRAFEKFSAQVEDEDSAASSSSRSPTRSPARLPTHPAFVSFVKAPKSPKKLKPNVPKLRYKDRHPDSKYVIGDKPTPMDVDEYVYDTYEIVKPDANGHIPDPVGTVGVIVLEEEDEEFWFGDEESEDFATDSDDENAEDYYANDYPEDEMSSDDEFGRNDYAYYHGDDSEEFDLAEVPSSEADFVGLDSDDDLDPDEDTEYFDEDYDDMENLTSDILDLDLEPDIVLTAENKNETEAVIEKELTADENDNKTEAVIKKEEDLAIKNKGKDVAIVDDETVKADEQE